MTLTFDDSHYDAFMLWAFEPPPIGRPGLSATAVRLDPPGALPEILIEDRCHPVIGVTSAGWLSVVDHGWRRLTGDPGTISAIADACHPIQCRLLEDRGRFDAAFARHMARSDESRIGGVPVIVLEDGRRAVRLADIAMPEVEGGIRAALDAGGRDFVSDAEGRPRLNTAPPGFLDADLWWWFARTWSG